MNAASAYFIPFFLRTSVGLSVQAQIRIVDDTSLEIAYQAIEARMFGTVRPYKWMVSCRGTGAGKPLYVRESSGKLVRSFVDYASLLSAFDLSPAGASSNWLMYGYGE